MRKFAQLALFAGSVVALACAESTSTPTSPATTSPQATSDWKKDSSSTDTTETEDSTVTCRLDSVITVVVTYQGSTFTHTYRITSTATGSFTGVSTDSTEKITGTFNGDSLSLTSTYTNGYRYTINGTLNESTGVISGTGSSSTGQQFTFTLRTGLSCSVEQDCKDAPAVANAYLKSKGLKPRLANGVNVISQVAHHTASDGTFDGLKPCDAGFVAAVQKYVQSLIDAANAKK